MVFKPGQGGRPRGARNKLQGDFVSALASEFAEHGADAIRICRIEDPSTFLKIVASIMPKELEISDNRLQDISDDDLELFISFAQRQIANNPGRLIEHSPVADPVSREGETED